MDNHVVDSRVLTLQEAWEEFCRNTDVGIPGSPVRKELQSAIGLKSDTVRRWITAHCKAVGEVAWRLSFYLHKKGYRIDQIEQLPSELFQIGQFFADGKLDLSSLGDLLDIQERDDMTYIWRIFRSGTMTSVRRERLQKYIETHSQHTEHVQPNDGQPESVFLEKASGNLFVPSEDFLQLVASSIAALAPALRKLNADDTSAKARTRLRELVGAENLFHFANIVNQLNSERLRRDARSAATIKR